MERALELEKLERLKLDNELRRSRRRCEELEEAVARLLEEKRISNGREKKAMDRYEKISAENSRISDEYQTLVLALNEKVAELQRTKSEHDRIAGICEEEFRCFDAMVSKFDGVINLLEREKSAAAKAVEELKLENMELRRREKSEAQMYKNSFEKLASKMSRIEEDLAGVLSIDLGDLATVANEVRELAITEGSADSKGEDDDRSRDVGGSKDSKSEDDDGSSLNAEGSADPKGEDNDDSSWNAEDSEGEDDDSSRDAENGVASSLGVGSPSRSTESSKSGSSEKDDRDVEDADAHTFEDSPEGESNKCEKPLESDDRDMVQPCKMRDDADADTLEDSPERESNECEEPFESGLHLGSKHLHLPSTKSANSSPAAATIVIDIIDSDDETNPNGVTHLVPTPQTSKRNRTNSEEGLLTVKRQKDTCTEDVANTFPSHEKENQILESTIIGKESPVQKLSDVSDEDSGDEGLSDSKMIEMVKSLGKNAAYESMMQSIQVDDEFCTSAVCALYRQHLSASESEERPKSSTDGGFSSSDLSRVCGIAKYLIDGDVELRLRRSVSKVKKDNPKVIDDCRKLANAYAKKLFDLHWSAVDPFFRRS